MAATTSYTDGWDLSLAFGGNPVGAETNARLRASAEFLNALSKLNYAWRRTLPGPREWSVEADAFVLTSGGAEVNGSAATLTIGGVALKGWENINIELGTETDPLVDSTTGLDTVLRPTTRFARLSVDGNYFDPLGTGADALADVIAEVLGDTTAGLAVVVTTGGGTQFSFTGRPGSLEIGANVSQVVKNGIEVEASGAVTNTTSGADAGITGLLSAFFNAAGVQSGTAVLSTGTATNSEFTGTVYPTALRIQIPQRGLVTMSGTLSGSSALTHQATSA